MHDDELWAAVDDRRRSVVDLLTDLSPAQWQQPSLCAGWSVRDVAAHLSMQPIRPTPGLALDALRARGSTNRLIRDTARRRAARPTAELVAAIAASVGTHRPNIGLTVHEALIDLLVHEQDIALPLGRRVEMPPVPTAAVASSVWSDADSRGGRRKLRVFRADSPHAGFRFVATDTDWAAGTGPEIRGPVGALLLLLTGRFVALGQVEGDGAKMLAKSMRAGH
ncbi:MAG TPA: maleylpyruvate isomerase family mycothiol-dependent enzyme [Aldersonia sp.]